ncbi:hypothetical protein [Spongiactinospora sp. TRM90649]|nr:hypothetical protein [Spongiactinospora sp. TRM90649]MDF5756647.1 hypothetical protein [Spongiactinospora sp. TRM90649]
MTVDEALDNAVRLLRNAEIELDLTRMDRVQSLADSWINIAVLLSERERA